ncbi:MAG: hypothetical protein ABI818_01675 [Acidobacteriota bacterium]
MWKKIVVLVFACLIGVCASSLVAAGRPNAQERDSAASAPVAVQRVSLPWPGLRDEASMVLVGTALIGLAAAVRRAA